MSGINCGMSAQSQTTHMHIGRLYQEAEELLSTHQTDSLLATDKKVVRIQQEIKEIAKKEGIGSHSGFFSSLGRALSDFFFIHLFKSEDHILKKEMRDELHKVKAVVHRIQERIQQDPLAVKAQKKWESFEFPLAVVETAPDFVSMMYESGQIFNMKAFSNGNQGDIGIRFHNDGLEVAFEGKYVSLELFKKALYYDRSLKQLMYKESEASAYPLIYTALPLGFCTIREENRRGVRALQLSEENFAVLKQHAARFKEGVDPEKVKGVLQICTRVGKGIGIPLPEIFYKNGNEENIPPHYFFRIVDAQGNVYSKGVAPKKAPSLSSFGSVIPGSIEDIDYMEFRPNPLLVTTIPLLSEEKIEELFDFIHTRPRVFSFAKYNCTTIIPELLQKIGISLEVKQSLEDMIAGAVKKPLLNTPVVGSVFQVAQTIFSRMQSIWTCAVPKPIRSLANWVIFPLQWTASKIACVVKALLIHLLGAHRVSLEARKELEEKGIDPYSINQFSSWNTFFDPELQKVDLGMAVIKWQREQKNTEKLIGSSDEPRFQMLGQFEV